MKRIPMLAVCCAAVLPAALPAAARPVQLVAESGRLMPSYGEVAGAVLSSPIIADVTVREAIAIKGPQAVNLDPGKARFYVEADVTALIRGANPLPPRIGYLVDVPLDARGKPPKLRKMRALIFARPVSGRPDQLQLTALDGQRSWSPELDALVRRIVTEVVAPDAPPAITGIGNAFHVPGSLPGEGETQIFLATSNNAPISLIVLRRPGEQPRWAVSLGEIVDDAAEPPARDTLLWYRLACGLPPQLPPQALAAEEPDNARLAQEDYRLILRELGRCAAR